MKVGNDAKGHLTLDGARWHRPSKDDPSVCADEGCEHVMGTLRDDPWPFVPKRPRDGSVLR